jgi:hypothetical protein
MEGPQSRGRGEAVREYILTAEPSRGPPLIVYASSVRDMYNLLGVPTTARSYGENLKWIQEHAKRKLPSTDRRGEGDSTSQWSTATSWLWSFPAPGARVDRRNYFEYKVKVTGYSR